MPLRVDIVTPERVVYSEEGVRLVSVPGVVGELGVLPRHAAFMTTIEPGELRITKEDGEEMAMAISGGFIEVRENRVVILADTAERAEEIDATRAEEARRRAQEQLAVTAAEVDLARAEAALRRSLARLRVAERRRRRGGGPPSPGALAGG